MGKKHSVIWKIIDLQGGEGLFGPDVKQLTSLSRSDFLMSSSDGWLPSELDRLLITHPNKNKRKFFKQSNLKQQEL